MDNIMGLLKKIGTSVPAYWNFCALNRLNRGRNGVPDWPGWCYLPHAATQNFLRTHMPPPVTIEEAVWHGDAAICLPQLAAWRMGQGVYDIDPTLAAALVETAPPQTVPAEVLMHLPEWAVYIRASEALAPIGGGIMACLDYADRADDCIPVLRLWYPNITMGGHAVGLGLPLVPGMTIEEALRDETLDCERHANSNLRPGQQPHSLSDLTPDILRRTFYLDKVLPLILYLCSAEPDYPDEIRPRNPEPVKTKKGRREFAASHPRIWKIGSNLGEKLRQAERAAAKIDGDRHLPRPHLRRAHWHTYRVGKFRAGYRLNWLHPILVGFQGDEQSVDTDKTDSQM